MDALTLEALKIVGVYGIPLVIVMGVVYYLFKLLQERDVIIRDIAERFNDTMQKNVLVVENFKEWRDSSNRDHEKILANQVVILDRLK